MKMKALILFIFLVIAMPVRAAECCGDGPAAAVEATEAAEKSYLARWATEFKKWADNFEFLQNIIGLFNIFNDTIHNDLQILGAGLNAGQKAQAEMKIRTAEATLDTNAQTEMAKVQARIVAANMPPSPENKQLCHTIYIRQGQGIVNWWQLTVSQLASDLIARRYRGPGNDGAGPQYAADVRQQRCNLKTISSVDQKGPCTATDPDFVDADINQRTLEGLYVFELPPNEQKSTPVGNGQNVDVKVLDPLTKEQKLWMAALNFCAFAAGPRPTPAFGKDLDSPEAITQKASFNQGNVLESAFVSQCTNRIGKLTRPNCKGASLDPSVKSYCDTTIQACKHYIEAGGKLPIAGITDCDLGLSPYQKEYVSHMTCMLDQRYVKGGAAAGANHGQLAADSATICALSYTAWQLQMARENGNLVKAFQGLQDMPAIYAGSGAQPSKVIKINAIEGQE